MSEWQPIETAPRDGRDVLLWAAPDEEYGCDGIMDMAYYVRGHGWVIRSPAMGVRMSRPDDLYTHWRPLPEPPENDCS